MKTVTGLNFKGRASAESFLKQYDKRFEEPQYNVEIAVNQISQKISEDPNYHYELRSFDTIDGNPKTISFTDHELEFTEIGD